MGTNPYSVFAFGIHVPEEKVKDLLEYREIEIGTKYDDDTILKGSISGYFDDDEGRFVWIAETETEVGLLQDQSCSLVEMNNPDSKEKSSLRKLKNDLDLDSESGWYINYSMS
jgi:hypothetical protein